MIESFDITVRDGRAVHIRAIRLEDEAEFLQAFERLSAEARYMRFMRVVRQPNMERLRALLDARVGSPRRWMTWIMCGCTLRAPIAAAAEGVSKELQLTTCHGRHSDTAQIDLVTSGLAPASKRLVTERYAIVLAEARHLAVLNEIELAAARLLSDHAPRRVLEETTPHGVFVAAMQRGHLWVALEADSPVGFAQVEMLGSDHPHLDEIDVHPAHARRGLGTRLVRAVCEWAAAAGYAQITLTTFRRVAWNMPWYTRLGFVELSPPDWPEEVRRQVASETARGLDPASRLVMVYRCAMNAHTTLRMARPTDRLDEVVRFYVTGVGLQKLDEFSDHDGFDGVILGIPGSPYHLEFTRQRGHPVGRAPTREHLIVFHLPDRAGWHAAVTRMVAAGYPPVPPLNPYWSRAGQTFEDPDGYHVVFQHASWPV